MKLSTSDLRRVQLSLAAALLMMAIGAAGAYLAADSARSARLEVAAAQRDRNEIDGRLKRVRSEESEIKQKSSLFNALAARGVIGEEQRLDWDELLKAIAERRRLFDLQYEIAPQHPLDADAAGGAFAFYVSPMTLRLKLLHEEDLTRLLDDLRRQASALIQVKRCAVSRLPDAGAGEHRAQLQADCQIDWITLRAAAATGAKP